MTDNPLASFLLPEPFRRPGMLAMAHEGSLGIELARHTVRAAADGRIRRALPYSGRTPARAVEPVLLVPGFLAGDYTLTLLAASLRERGFRTYRSQFRANVGCTLEAATAIERRLESIAARRGSRVQIVGHSLGGMIARGVAVRRPDLVSGIVTMGSPMLAPGAHHVALSWGVNALVRLNEAGVPGTMSADCVAGTCARESFVESRSPLADDVAFTAVYSRRDGIVDWRACVDPIATPVEVTTSHCGMAVDPRVSDVVGEALVRHLAEADMARVARVRIA